MEEKVPMRTTDPRISFKWKGRNTKCKPYAINLGCITNDVPSCSEPHDEFNCRAAFMKRNAPRLDDMDLELRPELKAFVKDFLAKNFTPLPRMDPMRATEEWLSHNGSYNEQRKQQISTALSDFFVNGYERLGQYMSKKFYVIKSFIKREFYPSWKHCRLINGRSDAAKGRFGPFIHGIEEQVFKLPYFSKGKDIRTVPELINNIGKWKFYYDSDYSSFEAGFSPYYTDVVECELWRYMLKNNPEVLDDILGCYAEMGHWKSRKIPGIQGSAWEFHGLIPRLECLQNVNYSAKVSGCRMSGEMWTSLGNGFSNLMNFMFWSKKSGHKIGVIVEGDDGVVGTDADWIRDNMFTRLGFSIKLKKHTDIREVTFCWALFDPDELNIVIPPKQLYQVFWCASAKYLNAGTKVRKALLRARAMSLYVMGLHTPIVGVLAWKILDLLGPGKAIFDDRYKYDMIKGFLAGDYPKPTITQKSRAIYERRFLIPESYQLECETSIMKAKTIGELKLPGTFSMGDTLTEKYCNVELVMFD